MFNTENDDRVEFTRETLSFHISSMQNLNMHHDPVQVLEVPQLQARVPAVTGRSRKQWEKNTYAGLCKPHHEKCFIYTISGHIEASVVGCRCQLCYCFSCFFSIPIKLCLFSSCDAHAEDVLSAFP